MKFSEFNIRDVDILGEIGNISVGNAASSLSDFVHKMVVISIPDTKMMTFEEVKKMFGHSFVVAKIDYLSGIEGTNMLLMGKEEAKNFCKLIVKEKLNEDVDEWNGYLRNVLAEVFNIMVGNMTAEMSKMFNEFISIETPKVYDSENKDLEVYKKDEKLITIWFEVRVENKFKVKLVKILTKKQGDKMLDMIKEDHNL